jgi:hypothetical protein
MSSKLNSGLFCTIERIEVSSIELVRTEVAHDGTRAPVIKAALSGGFVAGTLDVGVACLISWASPYVICQTIACGVLGVSSFYRGMRSTAFGLLRQWLMSIIIAAFYVGANQWFSVLRRRWIFSGCAYGIPVFVIMNYVVLPPSAIGHVAHFTPAKGVGNILAWISTAPYCPKPKPGFGRHAVKTSCMSFHQGTDTGLFSNPEANTIGR